MFVGIKTTMQRCRLPPQWAFELALSSFFLSIINIKDVIMQDKPSYFRLNLFLSSPRCVMWLFLVRSHAIVPAVEVVISRGRTDGDPERCVNRPVFQVWTREMLPFRTEGLNLWHSAGSVHDPREDKAARCDLLIRAAWCVEKDWREWKHIRVLSLVSAQIKRNHYLWTSLVCYSTKKTPVLKLESIFL